MKLKKILKGDMRLLKVSLAASNFDQHKDKWKVQLIVSGSVVAEYDQNDVLEDADGNQYLSVDTSNFPDGVLYARATACAREQHFDETNRVIKSALIDCGMKLISTINE